VKLVNAGLKFAGGASVNLSTYDGTPPGELDDANLFAKLAKSGLTLSFGSNTGAKTIEANIGDPPIFLTVTDAQYLLDQGLRFGEPSDAPASLGPTLIITSASTLSTVANAASSWAANGIKQIGITQSVGPSFSQAVSLIDTGLSLVRVAPSGSTYTEIDSAIGIRARTLSDLGWLTGTSPALTPAELKAGGIDVLQQRSWRRQPTPLMHYL